MKLSADEARHRFGLARVARLATVTATGKPHLVPVTFGLAGTEIISIVDDKPKSTANLQRLRNITANAAVSILVDHYDEEWRRLWWARADGTATLVPSAAPEYVQLRRLLVQKYPQYQANPPSGQIIRIHVERWSGWSATA